MSLGTDLKTLIAQSSTADGDVLIRILERIDEEPTPTPHVKGMPPNALLAAYQNYHALRGMLDRRLREVGELTGQIAEAAAKVIQEGGEI